MTLQDEVRDIDNGMEVAKRIHKKCNPFYCGCCGEIVEEAESNRMSIEETKCCVACYYETLDAMNPYHPDDGGGV